MAVAVEVPADAIEDVLTGEETAGTSATDQSWSVSDEPEADTPPIAGTNEDQDTTLFDHSLALVQALQAAPGSSGAAEYGAGITVTVNDALSVPAPVLGAGEEPQRNGDGSTVVSVAASGSQSINGLIAGNRWAGTTIGYSTPDAAADYQAGYFSDQDGDGTSAQNEGFSRFSTQQLNALHYVFNADILGQPSGASGYSIEGFTNLTINSYNNSGGVGTATMRYANTSDAGTAYNFYPSNSIYGGDGWFGPNTRNPVSGNYSWMTTIHEVGHGMGLAHGHTGGAFGALPSNVDSHEFSIMTYRSYIGSDAQFVYNETYGYPQTFMMLDIAALQYMYGADFTSNGGNTTYTWDPNSGDHFVNGVLAIDMPGLSNSNRVFMTIWDGNGIDTYDLSNYTTNLRIDLRPGENSTLSTGQLAYLGGGPNGGYARGNVFNALQFNGDARSLIENAIGGSGSDTITGNTADNTLTGNGNADVLSGGAGFDTYRYVAGSDIVAGETITDSGANRILIDGAGVFDFRVMGGNLPYNAFNEIEFGVEGNTVRINGTQILAALNVDGFVGGGTNIFEIYHPFAGGSTNISGFNIVDWTSLDILRLYGFSGNETLTGHAVGTYIYAGAGNDTLNGAAGNDFLYGEAGNDTLLGNLGNDFMAGGADDDIYSVNTSGDVVLENLNQGNDRVYSLAHYTLGANIEQLFLVGTNINGAGNALDNWIFGTDGVNNLNGNAGVDRLYGFAGTDVLTGGTGNDILVGGLDNDTYFVDSNLDTVVELAGNAEGTNDVVYASTTYWLTANVETLRIVGAFNGTGNSAFNWIFGDINANGIRGGGAADYMSGGGGFDTFVLAKGETQGDVIADFDGLGAANGDRLLLTGWGAGATVTYIGSNNWRINSTLGSEYFQLANGYTLHASDFTFV